MHPIVLRKLNNYALLLADGLGAIDSDKIIALNHIHVKRKFHSQVCEQQMPKHHAKMQKPDADAL